MSSFDASGVVTLIVKWGKETVTLEKYDPATGVKGLKTELSELTGVPLDRMKIMAKSKGLWKGVMKDDADLSAIDWATVISKNGGNAQLLLMGSAAELDGPKVKTLFVEDLPQEQLAKVVEPSGLVNLGNTCYMNSVVQCLRAIPQLRNSLQHYSPAVGRNNNNINTGSSLIGAQSGATSPMAAHAIFLASLRETYRNLDRQATAYQPIALVHATKMAFPQFAQTGPHGQPMQQDAEEFFSGLLTIAASETQHNRQQYFGAAFSNLTDEELMGATNVIDAIFGLKMKETLSCAELSSIGADSEIVEPDVISYDLHRKLVCNIQGGSDGNAVVNINHINEGIKLSLEGTIEKHSMALGRNAMWNRTQRIARLPPVLAIQFGRFYWKATPDSQDHAGVKCKVMKPVSFQSTFDVYEFCTAEIQKTLQTARSKALAAEEERIANVLKGDETTTRNDTKMMEEAKPTSEDGNTTGDSAVEDVEMDDELKAALALSMQTEAEIQPKVGPGLPADFQGFYELFAVVTHKGRDADGGHYMAWVKADSNSSSSTAQKITDTDEMNEDWFVFDDDEVSPCKTEDVLKLKGGGDWHMSYLNFYRVKK